MLRWLGSLVLGIGIGAAVGLYLGWVQFPLEYVDSPTNALAQRYQDEYTVMIAGGYLEDGDALGAVERLRVLGVDNVPEYVQQITERFITTSRDVADIRYLVALSEGLGRTSPLYAPYRAVSQP
ncbi:MAG: hypothetical protein H7Y11_04395 [Armatimonadetes bacterium]|nr:hypothetical protein [Anaerolineae bacterium]